MANIITRSSVLGIMKETTEGTPVIPSAATDFIALQDGFSISPGFETLSNAELRSSIGASKPIRGAESPTASGSHYLRASGTVATAPNYGDILESAFGATSTAGAEYDTVASSTTSVIKVDTGEGATFERGEALLIKDTTNGYRIRCIDSVSGDNLTIGFEVPTAPAVSQSLGRAVLYKPANSGHPTLTLRHYVGNGGAVQMASGMRVTNLGIDISAGELINMSYSLEGLEYYFNPIYIASTDAWIDWTDDDGTFEASVAVGWYKDPYDLAAALETAMNDVTTETVTVAYLDASGKFQISATGTVLSLLWNTGDNTANTIGSAIGFSVAADDSGTAATTGYTSDSAVSWAAEYTPSYDSSDPLAAKDNEVMVGSADDYACFKASSVSFSMDTPKANIASVCAESGKSGSVVASRAVTVSVSALLEQHQVEKFKNYRSNDEIKLQYSFGTKTGGNWTPGKCGALYVPTAVISSFDLDDADGLVQLNLELTAFVNSSGEGEAYLNFL